MAYYDRVYPDTWDNTDENTFDSSDTSFSYFREPHKFLATRTYGGCRLCGAANWAWIHQDREGNRIT